MRQVSAQHITVRKSRATGISLAGSELAQLVRHGKGRSPGQAVAAAGIAQPVVRPAVGVIARTVNQATTSAAVAQPFGRLKTPDFEQVVADVEEAQSVGTDAEPIEIAQPITVIRGDRPIGQVTGTANVALPVAAVKVGGHIIDLISQAVSGTNTALSVQTAGPVPWAMPSRAALLFSSRRFFAHWSGSWYTGANTAAAYDAEVSNMVKAGFDGVILDGYSWPPGTPETIRDLGLIAAAARNGGFFVVPMTDGAAGLPNAFTMADRLVTNALSSPASYRLGDGTFIVSPWRPDVQGSVYWSQVVDILTNNRGFKTKLAPIFLSVPASLAPWAPLCHVMGSWGEPEPSTVPGPYDATANQVKATGAGWAQPVRIQDVRPLQGFWWEGNNMDGFRYSWNTAVRTSAQWVHVPTWNDHDEGADIQPSARRGMTFVDLMAYWSARWKQNVFPPIIRDGLFLIHRRHRWKATPTSPPPMPMTLVRGSPTDLLEVWAFTTQPGTLILKVNGVTSSSMKVAAGSTVWKPTLPIGQISVELVGAVDDTTISSFTVVEPPPTQDLQYLGVASLRS